MALLQCETMKTGDWEQVRNIYLEGIATGDATFQQTAPSWTEWDKSHCSVCRIVARSHHQITGWAALSRISDRVVYSGVAEVSVYVAANHRGKGIGKLLLTHLIESSENNGFWTLQAGIFPENQNSILLHKTCGFKEVGRRDRIGKMNGSWRDVILLERRSAIIEFQD